MFFALGVCWPSRQQAEGRRLGFVYYILSWESRHKIRVGMTGSRTVGKLQVWGNATEKNHGITPMPFLQREFKDSLWDKRCLRFGESTVILFIMHKHSLSHPYKQQSTYPGSWRADFSTLHDIDLWVYLSNCWLTKRPTRLETFQTWRGFGSRYRDSLIVDPVH